MKGNGAHTLVLLLLLSEFIEESTQFLFCSNMSMTECPKMGTGWRISESNR